MKIKAHFKKRGKQNNRQDLGATEDHKTMFNSVQLYKT